MVLLALQQCNNTSTQLKLMYTDKTFFEQEKSNFRTEKNMTLSVKKSVLTYMPLSNA